MISTVGRHVAYVGSIYYYTARYMKSKSKCTYIYNIMCSAPIGGETENERERESEMENETIEVEPAHRTGFFETVVIL